MKQLLVLLFTTIALAAAPSADVSFVWNANPESDNVTSYRIYELDGTSRILRAEVGGDMTNGVVESVLLDKRRTFVCRAVNAVAESDDSNPAHVDPAPQAPTGMKVQVIVTVTVGE